MKQTLKNSYQQRPQKTPQTSYSAGEAQNKPNDVPPATNVVQTRESLANTDGIDGSFTSNNNNPK